MEELVLHRQALPPETAVRPPTADELAALQREASYGRPWTRATAGPWADPRWSDHLMPLGARYNGGQMNARRADGSCVRGVVWGACQLLEGRGLFAHDRQLEEEVEATFGRARLVPPVRIARGRFDPAALADAHAAEKAGEQLGLTL